MVELRVLRALGSPLQVALHEVVHVLASRPEDLHRGAQRQVLGRLLLPGGAQRDDLVADEGHVEVEVPLEGGEQPGLLRHEAGRPVVFQPLPDPAFLLVDLAGEARLDLRPGGQHVLQGVAADPVEG